MKRISAVLAACLLAACGSDSSLPEASGKANFRAINSIPTSGEIVFLIEERGNGTAGYQDITATTEWDDLPYNFNFDVFFAGETELTRIATQFVDAVADRDYTFVISGTIADPTLTLFEDEVRELDTDGTVFAAKFLNSSTGTGALDFYFADPAVSPGGEPVATLSPGELSASADFGAGEYAVTLTTAGDPSAIVYQSESVPFVAGNSFFITLFDGDANDTAPLIVQALPSRGSAVALPDPSYPPAVEFINISPDLGASDIYDDEALTSLIVQDHDFRDVEDERETASGTNTFYYTPTGETSAVTLEGELEAISGTRYRFYAAGVAGAFDTDIVVPDRKSLETMVKLTAYHGANNFDFLNLYALEPGESVDDNFPVLAAISRGSQTPNVALTAGVYDIYVTEFNDKTVLAGPYRVDTALGDIVDFVIVDTVDPAVLDALFLSGTPIP